MIFDTLPNLSKYANLSIHMEKAIQFILNTNLQLLPEGKHEIDSDSVFILVSKYQTKPEEKCVTESHKKYIDIQIMIEGAEKMGVAFLADQRITEPYNNDKDCVFYNAELQFLTVNTGEFVVFFPTDLHSPSHQINAGDWVKKAVVKVQV